MNLSILFLIFSTGATTLTEIDTTKNALDCYLSLSVRTTNSSRKPINPPKEEMEKLFRLGILQFHGSGMIARNQTKAKEIFEELTKRGHQKAKFELAQMLLLGYSGQLGEPLRREPERAIKMLQQLSRKGYTPAQEFLMANNKLETSKRVVIKTNNVIPIKINKPPNDRENRRKQHRL